MGSPPWSATLARQSETRTTIAVAVRAGRPAVLRSSVTCASLRATASGVRPPVGRSRKLAYARSGLLVGASNSSNSNRLREIGEELGVPSYLIEDASALDEAWLDGAEAVGITAGASAPDELVQELVEALRRRGAVDLSVLPGADENVRFRMPAELTETA